MTGSAAYCWRTDRRGWLVALFVTVIAHAGIYQAVTYRPPTRADTLPVVTLSLVSAPVQATVPEPATQPLTPVQPHEPAVQTPEPRPQARPQKTIKAAKPAPSPPRQVEEAPVPDSARQTVTSTSPSTDEIAAAVELPLEPPLASAAYLRNPPPTYPKLLLKRGVEGSVLVRVQVQDNGHCSQVLLKESSGFRLFDEAALSAVRNWRFVPARKGTQTVVAWVDVPIEFRITRTQ